MRISRRVRVSNLDQTQGQYGAYNSITKVVYKKSLFLLCIRLPDQIWYGALADLKEQVFQLLRRNGDLRDLLEFPRVNMKVLVGANDRILAQWVTSRLKTKGFNIDIHPGRNGTRKCSCLSVCGSLRREA